MLKTMRLLVLLALFAWPGGAAAAQGGGLDQTYVIESAGITLHYPSGWQIERDPEGAVLLTTGEVDLAPGWYFPEHFDALGITPGDAASALEYSFFPTDEAVVFDRASVRREVVEGRVLTLYSYDDRDEQGPYTVVMAAVEAPDGSFFVAEIYPLHGLSVPDADLFDALRIVAAVEIASLDAEQAAPDETRAFEFFETRIVVDVPSGWADYLDEDAFLTLESAATVFEPRWYFADELPDLGLPPGDVVGVLGVVAGRLSLTLDPAQVEIEIVQGRTLFSAVFTREDELGAYETLLAGVVLDDGSVLTAYVYPIEEAVLNERDAALGILASARIAPPVFTPPDAPLDVDFTFEGDGVRFAYPSAWSIADDDGFIYLYSDVTYLDPYYTLADDLAADGIAPDDLAGGLESLWRSLYEDEGLLFDPSAVEQTTVEGRALAVYRFEHPDDTGTHEHWMTAVRLDDGSQFYADAYPRDGDTLEEPELALRITASAQIKISVPAARRSLA